MLFKKVVEKREDLRTEIAKLKQELVDKSATETLQPVVDKQEQEVEYSEKDILLNIWGELSQIRAYVEAALQPSEKRLEKRGRPRKVAADSEQVEDSGS